MRSSTIKLLTTLVMLAMLTGSVIDAAVVSPAMPTDALPSLGQVIVAAGAGTVSNSTDCAVGGTSCSGQSNVVPA